MLDFFGEPANSPRRIQSDGAYTSYMIGPEGQRVHIILPDLRYNRSPLSAVNRLTYTVSRLPKDMGPYQPSDDPQASMLGENQWQWLEAELAKPADVKILVSSLQVLADFTGWEAWVNFPADHARLMANITEQQLDNLLIVSGDTHWAEVSRQTVGDIELVDLTASGMTEEWQQISPNQHRASDAFAKANFGLLTIDWDASPINVTMQIIAQNGEILIEQPWRPAASVNN
jgi:alkaline phosphatase D